MKVALISDTHDNLIRIRQALRIFSARGCEVLIHAGDIGAPFALKETLKFPGKVYAVFGNNDGERKGLKQVLPGISRGPLKLKLDGVRIVTVHEREALTEQDVADADVLVFGHNHRAEVKPGVPLSVNPGECGGWLTGRATVAMLDTGTRSAEIIELGASQCK